MKNILFVILLIMSALSAKSQTYDSAFLQNLADELVAEMAQQGVEYSKKREPEEKYWVEKDRYGYYPNGYKSVLSYYSAKFSQDWVGDINGDGEQDILIEIIDSGGGGGGNDWYADFYLLVMQNKKVASKHFINVGSKMWISYLKLDSIKTGVIFCTLEENGKYIPDKETYYSVPLQLVLYEGIVTDKSALDCEFKPERRRIFLEQPDYRIESSWSNSKFYFPKLEQTLTIRGSERLFNAEIEGCETIKLQFSSEMPMEDRFSGEQNVRKFIKGEVRFFGENTHFSRLFDDLAGRLDTAQIRETDYRTEMEIELSAGWKAKLFLGKIGSEEEGERFSFIFNFIRRKSPEIDNFHEQWWADVLGRF